MARNHQVSSNGYDGYHGAVRAKELHSQKQPEHGNMRAESGGEGRKSGARIHDGFYKSYEPVGGSSGNHQPRDKIWEIGHRRDEIDKRGHDRNFDRCDFVGHNFHRQDAGYFSYGKLKDGFAGVYGVFQGTMQIHRFTQITITHSVVFSGAHFGSLEKRKEAYQNFLDAAFSFINSPGEQAYKSLNDAMTKLMDPKFAPAIVGGAAMISIRDVNGATMVKFTMEVTPAPAKTLEEAREDLRDAYSSRRDGEKNIASIREEAYTNYIRALSEKFKRDGVISHTNNTPTTPVFKASVIYIAKVTLMSATSFHEIKKPDFKNNLHGRLICKNQRDIWGDYRQTHKSYVDMLKQDSRKSHMDKNFKARKAIEAKHDYRHSVEGKMKNGSHKHHNKARTDKAS